MAQGREGRPHQCSSVPSRSLLSISWPPCQLPASVWQCLDRTKEPGAIGEPLYQDICSTYKSRGLDMDIVGGRYGLSSKDTTPGQIIDVLRKPEGRDTPKNAFTIGIVDDVTHTSLPVT